MARFKLTLASETSGTQITVDALSEEAAVEQFEWLSSGTPFQGLGVARVDKTVWNAGVDPAWQRIVDAVNEGTEEELSW